MNSAGVVKTAVADEARFDYDIATGELNGLLLEDDTANHVATGCDFTSSNWKVENVTVDSTSVSAPDGTNTAIQVSRSGAADDVGDWYYNSGGVGNGAFVVSCYMRSLVGPLRVNQSLNMSGKSFGGPQDIDGEWKRYSFYCPTVNNNTWYLNPCRLQNVGDVVQVWGVQFERVFFPNEAPSSLIITGQGGPSTRTVDVFSLSTTTNFNEGFSLLLDTQTTTDDFLYRIKAGGNAIASLTNDAGTLEWVINGKSAQLNGEYPVVGFLPGRVRTVSSFGPSGQGDVENYLYTTGISFPTTAAPAGGANEIEFGTPQNLKALYVWDGQLNETNAVSLIRGKYNVVPNVPIDTDAYSFVYNTDPNNEDITSITLPTIVPTVGMIVDWGDGTNGQPFQQGVIPSHTYPYPGQYRIQITSDAGFDDETLYSIKNTITRVDQWPIANRVDATGNGFTGDDLALMLYNQQSCTYIPPFKYTNLTDITYMFYDCRSVEFNGWNFIPRNLESCITMEAAFASLAGDAASGAPERSAFPQLKTSSALKNVSSFLSNTYIKAFKAEDGSTTNRPFTDSSGVTNWKYAFANNSMSDLAVDVSAAENLYGTFQTNSWVVSPFISAPLCTDWTDTFRNCGSMASMDPSIDVNTFSNGISFGNTWRDCKDLSSFPPIVVSKATTFVRTWYNCYRLNTFPRLDFPEAEILYETWYASGLLEFPLITVPKCYEFRGAWQSCSGLLSFPLIDFSSATSLLNTWNGDANLNNIGAVAGATTSFPQINTSKVTNMEGAWGGCRAFTKFAEIDTALTTNFYTTWINCSGLESFPVLDTSSGVEFGAAWQSCAEIKAFPSLDFSSGENFGGSWNSMSSLTDFPANMFDTTGTLRSTAFRSAWYNCRLTVQSIENILVSLDTNGQSNIELDLSVGNAPKSTWTPAANTAYTNLINKGWTIAFNP